MSKDPEKKVPHLKVTVDYLRGMKYKEIFEKYNITCGGLQYSLEKMGVRPNRIKSSARLKSKVKEYKTREAYLHNAGFLPVKGEIKKDNNPVLVDDLDIMERIDGTNGTGDPSCEIEIDEGGEASYEDN